VASALPPERIGQALASIAAWRASPEAVVACPICAAPGLQVIDRSARPFAEWYAVQCGACGLDASVHVPLGGAMGTGE